LGAVAVATAALGAACNDAKSPNEVQVSAPDAGATPSATATATATATGTATAPPYVNAPPYGQAPFPVEVV
jgi:hypothetical protein